jgi:SpoIID/LytB domain protein
MYPNVFAAVKATRGIVLKYKGEICDARFSKCCGGVMEKFSTCWENKDYPYLDARRDDASGKEIPDLTTEEGARQWIESEPESFCNTKDANVLRQVLNNYDQETTHFFRWKVEYTEEQLSDLIKRRTGKNYGKIKSLEPLHRGSSGRIDRLRIIGSRKTRIIGKELEIRHTLSESHLYSSAFVVKKEGKNFILSGAGWGHGVGLCQIGAALMASKGYKYDEILQHYYPHSELISEFE